MNKQNDKIILDPIIQKFLDTLASKKSAPIYTLAPVEARKVLDYVQSQVNTKTIAIDIEDHIINGSQKETSFRIFRPKNNKEILPVIIWMHGGGWVLGNKETHDRLIREITHGTQAAVVFVNYTLAPEGQYPLAHEEGYAVAKWIYENGQTINLNPNCMAIAGDSVGGLLATAITMMSKQRGGPKFIFQALLYPVTDANFETSSYQQFEKGYWLERESMKWFWDSYVPDLKDRKEPLVSPLNASLEDLKNLPPALIITNEYDVLRDEGEAYAHKLMQANVPVVATRYLGIIHDSALLNAITEAPGIRAMILQTIQMLKLVFEKSKI